MKFIIDGDMPVPLVIKCIDACGYWNEPTVFRTSDKNLTVPKKLIYYQNQANFHIKLITTPRAGAESADKIILMEIASLISSGDEVILFTIDHDFFWDAYNMSTCTELDSAKLTIITPFSNRQKPATPPKHVANRVNTTTLLVDNIKSIREQISYNMR